MVGISLQQSIHRKPQVIVGAFLALMVACVLGLVAWKASVSRESTLARAQEDLMNLARSLSQHAANSIKAPEVAMTGMVDLLKYQNPLPQRFNAYLQASTEAMHQIQLFAVLNADGSWRYSSLPQLPSYNNSDRPYFTYHRDNPSTKLLISGPVDSRITGRPTIILSKRISNAAGDFIGVLVATIECEFFSSFYSKFNIGTEGGISLILQDGTVLARWPVPTSPLKLTNTASFQERLNASPMGSFTMTSPFDGVKKYIAYERGAEYPVVVTVARSEHQILEPWWTDLMSDALVAGLLVAIVAGMAALLSGQFHFRARLEHFLRDREARVRLLTDNIADIVVVMDRNGCLRYVSPSVVTVLGMDENAFLGRACLETVHEDDRHKIVEASRKLKEAGACPSVRFRMRRSDGETVWLECRFKVADHPFGQDLEIVGVLRDVTEQTRLEEELSSANLKLAQLATTDSLTRLANRRNFDAFLRDAYAKQAVLSVLLIDIDHFKGFNDSLGHQAGDSCLKQIAEVIGSATKNTGGLSARYGGEEFAVVLPGVDEARAVKVADAIRLLVSRLSIYHPRTSLKRVTISVGVAAKSETTGDELGLTREADIALYYAKSHGRDRTVASSQIPAGGMETASLVPSIFDMDQVS